MMNGMQKYMLAIITKNVAIQLEFPHRGSGSLQSTCIWSKLLPDKACSDVWVLVFRWKNSEVPSYHRHSFFSGPTTPP